MIVATQSEPIASGEPNEEFCTVPSDGRPIVPANMRDVVTGLEDEVAVPDGFSARAPEVRKRFKAIPDGNRGAILPDTRVELWDRVFLVSLKGTGARIPMYNDPLSPFPGLAFSSEPSFTSESWFGENPWGAMSHQACHEDREITELTGPEGVHGFHVCPMVRATPLPGWIMKEAHTRFWYRRLDSTEPYYQQARLLPSDIRLFYQSDMALGRKTPGVLDHFEISSVEDLDRFIDNYVMSGIAALTLISRTIRRMKDVGHTALDFSDVWLDKDSVIAPDGTIFFADIEGLEWVPLRDDGEAVFRIKRQFNRNFYEFMYGLDCLLKERDKMAGTTTSMTGIRQGLAARLELALEHDSYADIERSRTSLRLISRPCVSGFSDVSIKVLDLE